MKPIYRSILLLLFATALVAACSRKDSSTGKTLYTCGMHPQIIQDHPGDCPICGMKLTPKASPAINPSGTSASPDGIAYYQSTMMPGETSLVPAKDSMGMEMVPVHGKKEDNGSSVIAVDSATTQKMNIQIGEVISGPLRRVIRTVGVVDYNETALADVTTKFRGWIEKLHVDSTGRNVAKGEPLFDIYSPDLYSAQNEYVLALNRGDDERLKASARTKLKLYDISEDQIQELEKTRQPRKTLTMKAPIDGVVVEKMAVQGQMIEAGMKLYRLADLDIVWVQTPVYEEDLQFIKLGQEAEVSLSYLPDMKFRGRVTYIYPTVDEKTRTARVRMEFHNPGLFLKPGMFATVELKADIASSAILVPDMAVLRSGERNTVFVALGGGRFEPREVTLGARAENDRYQIISGLKEGERVVTSGQFMLDSESQLREAIQKMSGGDLGKTGLGKQSPQVAMPKPAMEPPPVPTSYVCPMPEHESIKYTHGGKCPICGMTLIPADPGEPSSPPSPPATVAPGIETHH